MFLNNTDLALNMQVNKKTTRSPMQTPRKIKLSADVHTLLSGNLASNLRRRKGILPARKIQIRQGNRRQITLQFPIDFQLPIENRERQ
jgi:hypothetical protein